RKRRKARKVSCGNDGPWKAWKTQERFPTLPTALGNPAKAAGFPHSHSYGGGPYSYGKAKQKPSPTYNVPRWAKLNRRNGPKEVAKRIATRNQTYTRQPLRHAVQRLSFYGIISCRASCPTLRQTHATHSRLEGGMYANTSPRYAPDRAF